MKKFSLLQWALVLMTGLSILMSSPFVAAQNQDDPNRDQVPQYLREMGKPNQDLPLSTVITVNNYDNFNLGVDFAENNIAEHPVNHAWYFTAYNINTAHNTQDGINWGTSTPSFGASMQGDPVVAYDSIGNLFYQNMYGTSILGVKVIKSTDNGVTWGTSVTGVAGNDKNWMACDQTSGPYANNVYNVMTSSGGGNFSRSTDHGTTFTTTFSPTTQSLPGMMVCVGAMGAVQGGAVYVVTNSGSSFSSTYTFYRSMDGGQNFSLMSAQSFSNTVGTQVSGRNSVQNMRTRPYPMIAADNSYGTHRGRFYCVYASNDPPGNGNKPDIWCRYSDDGGINWSPAILVNDDVNPQSHHQWHPAIWCDKKSGRLYAMWMDTRDCPTNDSALIYASYSDNGGATWVANQAISNQKMKIDCPTCGGGGTPRYQGDYNGIVSNKKVSMAAWADFRQGTFMSTTAYFPDFAMAATPSTGTLYVASDSIDFTISVPTVKLYTDTVFVSGQVTPMPATGTLAFSYPQGNWFNNYPGSRVVRLKLSGNVPLGSYQVQLYAKGPYGTPAHVRTATISVQASLALSVSVSANPVSVCPGGTTQLQAFATGGTSPYTYAWTSNPAGFTSSLANPSASPAVNTWYICKVIDNVGAQNKDSVYVTLNSLPAVPGAITGNTAPCQNATESYSITPVSGATTYTWNVPSGAVITSGQTTPAITVQWGNTSGNITVTAGNNCGNSAASQLAVNLTPTPATPGPITGPTTVCLASTVTYSVPLIAGVTNTWTVPSDATILSGQGTEAITVLWGNSAGFVGVSAAIGACTSQSNMLAVNIEYLPGAASGMAGPDTVCSNVGGYSFSVAPINNASTYSWVLPVGATIAAGQGTNAITVDFAGNAVSGYVKAAGNNLCGTGPADSAFVVVMVCTGTGSGQSLSGVTLYPNPAGEVLNLSIRGISGSFAFRIDDVNGRSLYASTLESRNGEGLARINVSAFAPGIYFVRVTGNEGVFSGKFFKSGQ